MQLSRILVGTDFSREASLAVDRGAQLAAEHGSRLHLVHVSPSMPATLLARLGVREDLAEEMQGRAEAELEAIAERARATGLAVSTRVLTGSPASALAEAAVDASADLVVVGRRGERRLRDSLLGSTAERLVDRGATRTLIVGAPAGAPYSTILAPVALGPLSEEVIRTALALSNSALVRVLHVYDPPFEAKMHSYGAAKEAIAEHRKQAKAEATRAFGELLDGLDLPRDRLDPVLRRGHPVRVISRLAGAADVVVIGRRKSAMADLLVGSVAKQVLRRAVSDVLVLGRPTRG